MTKERKEEVVLIALVVSLSIHVGMMIYARPKTMTRVANGIGRVVSRGPMRVTKNVQAPEPVKIGSLMDSAPRRDEPSAKGDSIPLVGEMGVVSAIAPERPTPEVKHEVAPPEERLSFDVRPMSLDKVNVSATIPMRSIETPEARSADDVASPEIDRVPLVAAPPVDITLPAIGKDPDSMFLPSGIASVWMKTPQRDLSDMSKFKLAEEVYSKVDEKVVAEEKAAVRSLVEADDAEVLEKFVNVTMSVTPVDGWTYFRVMIAPRSTLAVIPKDIVLLLDASGSIGKDRMTSIRRAAKEFLRSATNTDDRFNLVAFRNSYTYAFRTWQDCNRASFEHADRWLGNLVAHGRTDVFSTISSVLTLPRHPTRPLIALVVTDGDANEGVSDTADILSSFTKLNDGLVSVYMYGVRSSANRELIDVLTHGNRGESMIFDGWRWDAGNGIGKLSERFRDPVLSDLRIIFASGTNVEAYPRMLKNIYRGDTLAFVGRVPAGVDEVSFSIQGLSGTRAYEGYFKLSLVSTPIVNGLDKEWQREFAIGRKLYER